MRGTALPSRAPGARPLELDRRERFEGAMPWFVAIGASGGPGLDDLRCLLAALPVPFPAVVLVVLHRPWNWPSDLRAVLADGCRHPIRIAEAGRRFEAGTVYIGEPSQHLAMAASGFCVLVRDPHRAYGNRTIDLLFRTVSEHGNGHMIGVILSGSLDDGSRGLSLIHHAGGLTMVLMPDLSGSLGMPENAISYAAPIDLIGDVRQIASGIVGLVQQ